MTAAHDAARAPRVGCDLQAVAPVAEAIAHRGERYLRAVLAPEEVSALTAGGGAPSAESVAGRFAAKEAVLKVLRPGTRDAVAWPQIVIRSDAHGVPAVQLRGEAALLADRAGLRHWSLSTSHDGGFAMAVACATAQ
ncbi:MULTISPECIES: holo-ACP synthase [Kocuria]|uniref:Holo-[acyl-carrier-protein] synthase n=1 Tax=Kocuria rhizophila (strain ATCC 9341 / DSM 348 / NBRC 103217 / DC2201) TaxID=378753 RepID=B2GH23_KOCRD|nr:MULTISPECIES: holo-ACP synthase [Kocuria]ASE11875.1 holo-ACP synthase [Kocuria rhizophila]BAG30389.1 holo-[acyl-carrier-protein] synthase [Kocuria rhizophila DC2201]VEH74346.1 Holo-[acyl-carrier-protein] synthase [Kocuria rhizophila]